MAADGHGAYGDLSSNIYKRFFVLLKITLLHQKLILYLSSVFCFYIMSFDQRKREEIRKYILSKIALRDKDFVAKTIYSTNV